MKKHILGILSCMLMITSTISPISGTVLTQKITHPLRGGETLYVGGSGLNNYSKIQDAIDAASDGDTVYVYDDSSPYHENIMINVSISLVGEDKNTTIIDGANHSHSVNITADKVTIIGFTIQNGKDSGIIINSDNNRIINNILSNNSYGIRTSFGKPFTSFQNNTITNNRFINDGAGIIFYSGRNTSITNNHISYMEQGILLTAAMNSNISFNIIFEAGIGIIITSTYNTVIYRNNISHNRVGVATLITSADQILQNNFIGNNASAKSFQFILSKLRILKNKNHLPLHRNVWRQNYWDEPRLLPYVIPGVFLKFTFQVDWHPAQEPYDIPVLT